MMFGGGYVLALRFVVRERFNALGGGGFLGSLLCKQLIKRGMLTGSSGQQQEIEQVVLLDRFFHAPTEESSLEGRVRRIACDISDRDAVLSAVGSAAEVSIFHLASMSPERGGGAPKA